MIGHRTRLSMGLAVLVLLALALPFVQPVRVAQADQGPTAGSRVFVPIVGSNFTFEAPPQPAELRFWAEQYALPTNGCTTLHWVAMGAKSVYLDGVAVAGVGTRQACPGAAAQFYQLEVNYATCDPALLDLVLTSGDPLLQPGEVIAQGTVQAVNPVADADPTQAGNQPGYAVQVANVVKLYAADATWNEKSATVTVSQMVIDLGFNGQVHWPIKAGQSVEFRAACDGAACAIVEVSESYLHLRSE